MPRTKKSVIFVFIISIFLSNNSFSAGGGWGSSGGELINDLYNPWWIKNTTEVKYCIEIDQDTISAKPVKIKYIIKKAFEYWKNEFSKDIPLADPPELFEDFFKKVGTDYNYKDGSNKLFHELKVGTQHFNFQECEGNEDLVFKFGYGSLSDQDINYINDPKKFVALSVRTSYDKKLLKGKGFVFVSSDIGPNKFSGNNDLIEKPWRFDSLLFLVVLHELGHVFGLPHEGSQHQPNLMTEFYPELLITKTWHQVFDFNELKIEDYNYSFFFPPFNLEYCLKDLPIFGIQAFSEKTKSYFSMNEDTKCIFFDINKETKEINVSISSGKTGSKSFIGTIKESRFQMTFGKMGSRLWLNDEQTVYKDIKSDGGQYHVSFLMGPFSIEYQISDGYLELADGTQKPIYIQLDPFHFIAYGLIENRFKVLIISSNSKIYTTKSKSE